MGVMSMLSRNKRSRGNTEMENDDIKGGKIMKNKANEPKQKSRGKILPLKFPSKKKSASLNKTYEESSLAENSDLDTEISSKVIETSPLSKSNEFFVVSNITEFNETPEGTTVTFCKDAKSIKSKKLHERFISLPCAPSAEESAFFGPPRYDWIDVEYSAAIKIQSFVRKFLTIKMLQRQRKTTAYMRRRKRKQSTWLSFLVSRDSTTSDLFCCGVQNVFDTFSCVPETKPFENDETREEKKQRGDVEEYDLRKDFLKETYTKHLIEEFEIIAY